MSLDKLSRDLKITEENGGIAEIVLNGNPYEIRITRGYMENKATERPVLVRTGSLVIPHVIKTALDPEYHIVIEAIPFDQSVSSKQLESA